MNYKVYVTLGFHINFYHSWRGDTPDEAGFGTDIRVIREIIVVASGCTDRTVEIAQARGARVLQNHFADFAQQRNFGLDHGALEHPWVLHLDTDESVPPDMPRELLRAAREQRFPAFRVASR